MGFFLVTLAQGLGAWSIAIAVLAGILKELWDKFIEEERFDLSDLMTTFAGGLVAYIVVIIYAG